MPGNDDLSLLLDACRRGSRRPPPSWSAGTCRTSGAAVRRRLVSGLRMRFDSQDFAQDVWLSFFRAALDRTDLRDEQGLVAFLSQMARLKVAEEYRHQTTQKVGLDRDVPAARVDHPAARGPSPSEAAAADDEWAHLTAGLSDRERQMLQMLRDGHTHADTAAAFQLSEKTVQRLVRRLLSRGALPEAPP